MGLAMAAAGAGAPSATLRIAIIAGAISAAKVALFAVGSSLFLVAHGASALPWLYVGLALVAGAAALALAPRLERACPVTSLWRLLLLTLGLAAATAAALALALPGAAGMLLMLAHLYNIGSEILLWLVAAAWLPAPELRRATVWIYLATALGGFVGGIGVERLLPLGQILACLAITLLGAGYAGLWLCRSLALPGRGSELGAVAHSAPAEAAAAGGSAWQILFSHPLGPLLGAGSFMLTLVWVMTEFLCLSIYELRIPDPEALARFLAVLYAALQLVEFGCTALVTGLVTRRLSPLARSVLFPLGAFLSLLLLGRSFSLPAAVLAHAYTEAASNGLFDPVHASNFAAVPTGFQARLRSVSEGMCYPLGMAAGGMALLLGPEQGNLELVLIPAALAAFLFVAVGAFTGIMVTPSLLTALGLTAELGPAPRRAELRAASLALAPWIRRDAAAPASAARPRRLGAGAGARAAGGAGGSPRFGRGLRPGATLRSRSGPGAAGGIARQPQRGAAGTGRRDGPVAPGPPPVPALSAGAAPALSGRATSSRARVGLAVGPEPWTAAGCRPGAASTR